jgi:hypothetical protein
MIKSIRFSEATALLFMCIFLAFSLKVKSQDKSDVSTPLPDNITKIVTVSCMPCHSSTGGTLSKAKLNFNEWTEYSAEKQKKMAQLMYKEVRKNEMPPKSAREVNPGIIPTSDQIDMIKAWAKSFDN